MRALLRRLRGTLRPIRRDREFTFELDAHVQSHIDDNVRAGMTPDQARRAALLALGGALQTKELYRRAGSIPWIDDLREDVKYAVRSAKRAPGFAATAIAVIALGIGAATAAFTVLDHVLLRPLPFPQPDRLVRI